MGEAPAEQIGRRRFPETSLSFSTLSISIDPPAVAPPSADARTVALLRRARERGVTTFDIAEARFPVRAERLLATAFPEADPELFSLIGRSVESLAAERGSSDDPGAGRSMTEIVRSSLERSSRRLAPVRIGVVDWDAGAHGTPENSDRPVMPPPTPESAPEVIEWATRLSPNATALPPARALFSGTFSLLEEGPAPLFDSAVPSAMASLIARNPFADGRLDGTRFASTVALGGPREGPVDLRHLHTEFDPILRLGFLTEGRRRTLAQAALHYVLRWPWVVTCVIPLPAPERFDEILGYGMAPPLSDDELERLGRVK